ncbi:MAG: response regulator [Eubacteriales bacterium]|nr:response regulator [Eubacteriales bacterium]
MQNTRSYKYLVAEDERLIRQNLIKKINKLGLPLELIGEAANGAEAIQIIEKNCPDIVITDIIMPQCDGLELTEYVYRNHPGVKIVILSGYNDFSYAQTAIKFSVNDYLLKPITPEALSASLQKFLITMQSESRDLLAYQVNSNTLDQKDIAELLVKYLHENYKQDVSFQELAAKFGFSVEYLGKIFKKHSGVTLSKYLTRLRMNEAKRLLVSHPGMEIQKIGELVGYKDSFYFSRAFKSFTGIQPSEYRNQAGEGQIQ